MTKREHPVEVFEREIIERAEYFTAFVQLAPGHREKRECTTRSEAEGYAQGMADGSGKAVLVYAVDSAGRQALASTIRPQKKDLTMNTQTQEGVPSSRVAREEAPTTYSARSAAIRAARAELGAEAKVDVDFTIGATGDRFTWNKVRRSGPRTFSMPVSEIRRKDSMLARDHLPAETKTASAPATDTPVRERPQPAPGGGDGRPPRKPPVTTPNAPRMRKATSAAFEAASKGVLPTPPDFSAETHKRFRPKLAELVKLVEAKNVAGLKAFDIKPISTSPKAMDRFRNLAVIALEAQATSGEVL